MSKDIYNKLKKDFDKPKKEIFESVDKWLAKGKELFGDEILNWEFVCPSCGNIQKPKDFQAYANVGSDPNDAYFICIGRFTGSQNGIGSDKQPCNYSSGGLFNLNKTIIKGSDGEKDNYVFSFNIKKIK